MAEIIETVSTAIADWKRFASETGVGGSTADIAARLTTVASAYG